MAEPAAQAPPVSAALQSLIPVSDWKPRRLFVWVLTAALMVIWCVARFHGLSTWEECALAIVIVLAYVLGASAEQVTQMIQHGLALRSGVSVTSTATATTAGGDAASSTMQAGQSEGAP